MFVAVIEGYFFTADPEMFLSHLMTIAKGNSLSDPFICKNLGKKGDVCQYEPPKYFYTMLVIPLLPFTG
jgi:hypothetical protein